MHRRKLKLKDCYSLVNGSWHPVDHWEPRDRIDELRTWLTLEQKYDRSQVTRIVEMRPERDEKVVDTITGKVGCKYDAPVGPIVLASILVGAVFTRVDELQTASWFLALQQVA